MFSTRVLKFGGIDASKMGALERARFEALDPLGLSSDNLILPQATDNFGCDPSATIKEKKAKRQLFELRALKKPSKQIAMALRGLTVDDIALDDFSLDAKFAHRLNRAHPRSKYLRRMDT